MNYSDTAVFFSTWGVQMHQSVGLSKGWRYGLTLFTPMTGWLPIQKIAADVIRLVPNFESGIFLGTHFDVAYMVYGWVYHVAKLQLVDSSKYVVQNYGKFGSGATVRPHSKLSQLTPKLNPHVQWFHWLKIFSKGSNPPPPLNYHTDWRSWIRDQILHDR